MPAGHVIETENQPACLFYRPPQPRCDLGRPRVQPGLVAVMRTSGFAVWIALQKTRPLSVSRVPARSDTEPAKAGYAAGTPPKHEPPSNRARVRSLSSRHCAAPGGGD